MAKMIQIRNVPDDVHRRLKMKAANEGMSLSDYLLQYAKHLAEMPTLGEIQERIRQLPPVHLSESVADAVRSEREAR